MENYGAKPEKRSFLKGLVAGFIIPLAILSLLVVFNVGNLGSLAQTLIVMSRQSLTSLSFAETTEGAMAGIVSALDDPYSYYLNEEEFTSMMEEVSGSYKGIGVYIGEDENSPYVSILSPIKGSPAFDAGLKAGDQIVSVDGESMEGKTSSEVSDSIKKTEETIVHLEILRDGETMEFDVECKDINIPTVEGQYLEGEDGIGYISISQFNDTTPQQFRDTLKSLQDTGELKGLILDVRNNGGGSVTAVTEIAEEFLPAGDHIFWTQERKDEEVVDSTNESPLELPVVMLVNENSASASEILAGALHDNGVATLVGTTTFGKGIIQTVFSLSDGSAVKVTTARYQSPDRHEIHEKGIAPDIEVEMSNDDPMAIYSLDQKEDSQLEAAVSEMKKQLQ
ncbi:MAG TPA: S41 family peptidase [Firmicutes bacterium]|nr:S41 family peptidase [Bacillota bacterium]